MISSGHGGSTVAHASRFECKNLVELSEAAHELLVVEHTLLEHLVFMTLSLQSVEPVVVRVLHYLDVTQLALE